MRFLSTLATFVAAVAASPITLAARSGCAGIGAASVLVGSKTQSLTGPFVLTVGDVTGTYANLNGNYATSGVNNNIVFGRKYPYSADQYYLTKAGALVSVTNGVMSSAYQALIDGFGHVEISTNSGGNPALKCSLNSSCQLSCSVSGGSLQCLSSPKYQPDWRISTHKSLSGCPSFTPVAKPPPSGTTKSSSTSSS